MWPGPVGIVVLVIILVGGLAGLAYLAVRRSQPTSLPRRAGQDSARV